jgi:hypothetical protein
VRLLGEPPRTPGAAAVWYHHALGVETIRDHEPPTHDREWKLTQLCAKAGVEIAFAHNANRAMTDVRLDPSAWAACAERARALAHGRRLDIEAVQRTRRGPELDLGL